ncbi:MAG TPA: disulfide bond formation regulator [Actinobacteria bacterium]|jgi:putative redox protein|nr:disulfide bond formation regulator [Actinomycetota bacterium]
MRIASREDRRHSDRMAIASSTDTPYVTTIQSAEFELIADGEFRGSGGSGGVRPHDLLDASLASCIAMTVRMAADGRGTKLERVIVEVTHEDADPAAAKFHCSVELIGDLSDKERAGLLRVAHHCPISKLLNKSIEVGITEATS